MSFRNRRNAKILVGRNGRILEIFDEQMVKVDIVEEVIEEEKLVEPIVIREETEKIEEIDTDLEPVICLNTGVIYDNCKVAMQETGVNSGIIKRNCKGLIKTGGKNEDGEKLIWKFVKDVEK